MLNSAALRLDYAETTNPENFNGGYISYSGARSMARERVAEALLHRDLLTAVPDDRMRGRTADLQPREARAPSHFVASQEWEGYVEEVYDDDRFAALLIDVRQPLRTSRQTVELQFSDVTKDDRRLIKIGAVFRWAIGYYDYNGSRNRMVKLVFRRLPTLTAEMLREARGLASDTKALLTFE